MMDIGHANKKSLRLHRRTVSSNLEDLYTRKEQEIQTNTQYTKLSTKQNNHINQQRSSWNIQILTDVEHEVVKLVNASSNLTIQKRVIIDSFESQQQIIKRIQNTIPSINSPYFTRKSIISSDQKNDSNTVSLKSFKKKFQRNQIKDKEQQTKNKMTLTKKNLNKPPNKCEYFMSVGSKNRIQLEKQTILKKKD